MHSLKFVIKEIETSQLFVTKKLQLPSVAQKLKEKKMFEEHPCAEGMLSMQIYQNL